MERFAGSRFLHVSDLESGLSFRVWLVYPTLVPSQPVAFGPYQIDVSVDAPLNERSATLPVIVGSHGSGSSPFLLRDLALRLARTGYLVALIEHPGNHRVDNTLADSEQNLVQRPLHVSLTLDALATDASLGQRVQLERVGLLGQSLGTYTGLAAAGGRPCSRTGQPLATKPDSRVAALVLLTPATYWFVPDGSLRNVTQPILIFAGEEDVMSPPWHAQLVYWTVPDRARVTLHVVPRAGHLSLLSQLPATAPWRDPEGFDRAGAHAFMGDEVEAFFNRTLRDSQTP